MVDLGKLNNETKNLGEGVAKLQSDFRELKFSIFEPAIYFLMFLVVYFYPEGTIYMLVPLGISIIEKIVRAILKYRKLRSAKAELDNWESVIDDAANLTSRANS